MPSAARAITAVFPGTVCGGLDCAPLSEYSICLTIPPGLSVARSVTSTLLLFQPFAFGGGTICADDSGASVSRAAKTARPLALSRPLGLSDDELTSAPIPVAGSTIARLVDPP